jgi:hypothetical protein
MIFALLGLAFTVYLWPLILVLILIGCFFMDADYDDRFPITPIVLAAVGFLGYALFNGVFQEGLVDAVKETWLTLLEVGGIYLAVGAVWSLFKFTRLCLYVKHQIEELLPDARYQVANHSYNNVAHYFSYKLESFLRKQDFKEDGSVGVSPKYPKNASRIVTWILYWPFSVMHYVCYKLLKELAERIMDLLRLAYAAISNAVFSDLKVQ